MKKRTYRTKKINKINWEALKESISGDAIAFAIDIAKQDEFACLSTGDKSLSELMKWQHPNETPLLLEHLASLDCPVTVIMESTSTYGDAIRHQCRQKGFDVHLANAKHVHDGREMYDGVPSSHDAKSATIISHQYWEGLTKPWRELTPEQRQLCALCTEYEIYQSQYEANRNRLEAYLSRHWPEVTDIIALDCVSLEQLLITYNSPQQIAGHRQDAEAVLRKASHQKLSEDKIQRIMDSAQKTQGVPCLDAESHLLKAVAQEMMHNRLQQNKTRHALNGLVREQPELCFMAKLIGGPTTAMLLSENLDPRDYHCPESYRKAMGMNLKEESSGKLKGRLQITKRGSSKARRYLYYAVLRLVQTCPVAKQWYQNKKKAAPKAPLKAIVAVMRNWL
jgi:transposase